MGLRPVNQPGIVSLYWDSVETPIDPSEDNTKLPGIPAVWALRLISPLLGVGFQDVVAVLIPTFAVEAVPVTAVVLFQIMLRYNYNLPLGSPSTECDSTSPVCLIIRSSNNSYILHYH